MENKDWSLQDRIYNFIIKNPTGHYVGQMKKGKTHLISKLKCQFKDVTHCCIVPKGHLRDFKKYNYSLINNGSVGQINIKALLVDNGSVCEDNSYDLNVHVLDFFYFNLSEFRCVHFNKHLTVYHRSFRHVLRNRARLAILCFLCIRHFRETLKYIPKEIIYMISKMIWKSKHDDCWEPFLLKI
jgi:hypothetical protein